MKSIIEVYKIGYGPNTDLHCMPYVACKEIKKMILNDFKKIDSIEICLYNEFAKYYHNDCKFKRVMIDGFKELKVPVRIKAVKITPPAVRALYTFDVNINLMKKTQTITHRVIGTGGGNYIITDIAKKPKYPFQNFAEMEKYFLTHKNISFLKYVNSYEKNDIIVKHFKQCLKVMNNLIASGLKKTGNLTFENKASICYKRRARAILTTKPKNESCSETINRLISAYVYAICEENISNNSKIVCSPTCSTTGILWGTLKFVIDKYKPSQERIFNGLVGAGLLCSLFSKNASIASDIVGCGGVIGTACGMTAALISHIIYNANISEMGNAFEMALEHSLGITCDSCHWLPIIPCIQRCASFALRAYEIAVLNHSLMQTPKLCKLDDVIQAVYETGMDNLQKHKLIGHGCFKQHALYALKKEGK